MSKGAKRKNSLHLFYRLENEKIPGLGVNALHPALAPRPQIAQDVQV
ncbi:MAG: hypothetical protein ACQEWV_06085 [Bacillota bacterium]